jgi:hypothetical protein
MSTYLESSVETTTISGPSYQDGIVDSDFVILATLLEKGFKDTLFHISIKDVEVTNYRNEKEIHREYIITLGCNWHDLISYIFNDKHGITIYKQDNEYMCHGYGVDFHGNSMEEIFNLYMQDKRKEFKFLYDNLLQYNELTKEKEEELTEVIYECI